MNNNQNARNLAESKRPGTGFTRTANPNGSQKPGSTSTPNPNYIPPATVKKP